MKCVSGATTFRRCDGITLQFDFTFTEENVAWPCKISPILYIVEVFWVRVQLGSFIHGVKDLIKLGLQQLIDN